MVDMSEYIKPVRKSLLNRELAAGVPQMGLLIIGMLALVFIYGFGQWIFAVPIAVIYFIMRHMTKQDQYMIDIILDNITQKDRYIS